MYPNLFPMALTCMNKFLLLLCLILNALMAFNQQVHVSFTNKSYAGDTLYVTKEKDFITNLMDTLTSSTVNKEGQWKVDFTCKEPMLIHIPLYFFEAWLYVEPNTSYQIKIPRKQYMSVVDSLNAYFSPIIIYPLVLNHDSSNAHTAIGDFDNRYDAFIEKNIKQLHYKIRKSFIDSSISQFNTYYSYVKSTYFHNYMFYKMIMIKYLSYERDQNFIIKYYFNAQPVLLTNTGYMDMFNQLFADYFSYICQTSWGAPVFDNIAKAKSPYELRHTLKHNPALTNDTLIDLVILKGLHDACMETNDAQKVSFPKKQLLMTLDSMGIVAKTPELRAIAQHIKTKFSTENMQYCYDEIPLKSLDGENILLRNFRGKYLYVCVHDFRSYDFYTDQRLMKANIKSINSNLQMITVVLYPNLSSLKEMLKKENFDWFFVTCTQPDLLKKMLQVKATPSYYLFNPNGELINKNAPPPNAEFVPYFKQFNHENR